MKNFANINDKIYKLLKKLSDYDGILSDFLDKKILDSEFFNEDYFFDALKFTKKIFSKTALPEMIGDSFLGRMKSEGKFNITDNLSNFFNKHFGKVDRFDLGLKKIEKLTDDFGSLVFKDRGILKKFEKVVNSRSLDDLLDQEGVIKQGNFSYTIHPQMAKEKTVKKYDISEVKTHSGALPFTSENEDDYFDKFASRFAALFAKGVKNRSWAKYY